MSAAAAEAIDSAGIKLAVDVSGAGMGEVKRAMVGICRALGYRGKVRIIGHE
jgi:hypothetical protein